MKTFSRIALGWAFCGPLAWTLRPKAHGLATNLQETEEWKKKVSETLQLSISLPLPITHTWQMCKYYKPAKIKPTQNNC